MEIKSKSFGWNWFSSYQLIVYIEREMTTLLCNECGKSFTDEPLLYIHQTRQHDKTSYSCCECPKFKLFIEHLENLGRLNEAVNRKVLDKTLIADIIEDIGRVFKKLQDQFDLSETMKIHVIRAHYMDFFESKQETLLSYTDEVCESMHSQIKYFEGGHRYLNNKKGSQSHSDMQHKSVVHLNSLNLGDV